MNNLKKSLWVFTYFAFNILLTIHTKWVLAKLNFGFPFIITAVHISTCGIGSALLISITKPKLYKRSKWAEIILLFKFSLIYTLNLVLNNVSLKYVSLSFHQIIRSTGPFFTLIAEYLFRNRVYPIREQLTLIPIIFGVMLTTFGEWADLIVDLKGIILNICGIIVAVSKGIITNSLLVDNKAYHSFELLLKLTPFCTLECLILAYIYGEFPRLSEYMKQSQNASRRNYIIFQVIANGTISFFLNWTGFTSNQLTSPLVINIVGNVKQVVSIIIGIYIFSISVRFLNIIGIIITLIGGLSFSFLHHKKALYKLKKTSDIEINEIDGK